MTKPRSLVDLSLSASRWLEESMLNRLRAAGWSEITRAQSLVFAQLGRGGARPSDLARRMQMTRQAMHGMLRDLAKLGLVELTPDLANRRAKQVVLTARGKRMMGDAEEVLRELERELEDRIGRKRLARYRRALESDWGAPVPASD